MIITFVNEGVSTSARLVVLLEDEDPLAGLGHDGPGGHAPDTRPDDDGVKMIRDLESSS